MILVTGASGTIGSATVAALKAKGAKFKAALRSLDKARALGVEAVEFDWSRQATYAPALAGIEAAFILQPTSETQVQETAAFAAAAKAAGVQRVVRLSVIGADAEPGIMLGRQHRDADKALAASGLAHTLLRPTFFMQNFVEFYGVSKAEGGTVYLPNGDGPVAWIDARDIGAVAAEALTDGKHSGRIYELTGGQALTTGEATQTLAAALGKPVSYVAVNEEQARQGMSQQGMPAWLVSGFLELSMIIRNGWAATVSHDVNNVLGRAPRTFASYAADLAAGRADA